MLNKIKIKINQSEATFQKYPPFGLAQKRNERYNGHQRAFLNLSLAVAGVGKLNCIWS